MTRKRLVISSCGQTGMVVCCPLRPEYAERPTSTLGVDMGALDAPRGIPSGRIKVEATEDYLFVSCGVVGRGA